MKRPPASLGDLIEIHLPEVGFCYALKLEPPLIAFYDLHSTEPIPAEAIAKSPIAFKIWVGVSAEKSARWKVIGRVSLGNDLSESPWFFKEDPISKRLTIYRAGIEKPVSPQDVAGLERAAVWSAEHVELRLQDHFMGRRNQWVEMLRPSGQP